MVLLECGQLPFFAASGEIGLQNNEPEHKN